MWLAATYFPDQGSNLYPLWRKCRVLTTGGGCSVTKSYPALSDPMDWSTSGFPVLHHLPEFAQTHVPWVGDAIHPYHSITPFFYPQSFTASGCFPVSQFFASRGQSVGALASVLLMKIQGWFLLGLTGLISLLIEPPEDSLCHLIKKKNFFFSKKEVRVGRREEEKKDLTFALLFHIGYFSYSTQQPLRRLPFYRPRNWSLKVCNALPKFTERALEPSIESSSHCRIIELISVDQYFLVSFLYF